jgi:hypothetical protein
MRTHRAVASRGIGRFASTPGQEHAMNKLRLNLDDLAVDTFQPDEDATSLRGTVDANEASVKIICIVSLKTDLTCCPCTPRF